MGLIIIKKEPSYFHMRTCTNNEFAKGRHNYSYLLCTHLRDVPPHVYVLYVRPQAHPSTHIFISIETAF